MGNPNPNTLLEAKQFTGLVSGQKSKTLLCGPHEEYVHFTLAQASKFFFKMYVWDHLIVKTDTGLVLLYYDPNRWDHWMETSLEQSWYVESKPWNTFNCRKSWIAYIKFNWYLVFLKHTCEIFPTCSSVVLGNKDEKKWKCKCCRNFLYQNQDPWIHQMDQSLRQGKHVNWNSKEVNTYHSHHSASRHN